MSGAPIWRPSQARIDRSRMLRFAAQHGAQDSPADFAADYAADYAALYDWSVKEPEAFWAAAWEFCGIRAEVPFERVVDDIDRFPGARWFPGAKLNFAANLLGTDMRRPAIVFVNERGERRVLDAGQLRSKVAAVAAMLRKHGVTRGDRIAALMPNLPETVVAMLAATSIGAVFSACSPDFGVRGILDRFGQIRPKILFAVDGYCYGGKRIDCIEKLEQVSGALDSIEAVVLTRYLRDTAAPRIDTALVDIDELASNDGELSFESLPFDHPVYILYTSGTTGPPKSIVHGAGGTLLQHKKEHMLHTDIGPGDRVFYYTSCGWMMWHWLVSALASDATIVLYDGSPFHPGPESLWQMAERESVSVFGTSAKYLSALEQSGCRPAEYANLDALGTILSTGSPLAETSFDFVYSAIKADVQLSSISGGTDIISCFALGNPLLPVYRGQLQCRGLGMKVEVFDSEGQPVCGEKGELVCTAPFPSMPVGFWDDADGQRYHKAYFDRFPGVWCHGDYAKLCATGGMKLYGRSDTVLNPGGVRIGTAEIYRIVEDMPQIAESIVIGQEHAGDTRIVLFVRLQPGVVLDEALEKSIRLLLKTEGSPRHVPAKIVAVSDIPRTMSGKIVEVAVREIVHGREVTNLDALANPEALEEFRDRPEIQ